MAKVEGMPASSYIILLLRPHLSSKSRNVPACPADAVRRHWEHHQMWWPRLFRHHGEIAWDDYEKDYSDLPEEVLQRHRWAFVCNRVIAFGVSVRRDTQNLLEEVLQRHRWGRCLSQASRCGDGYGQAHPELPKKVL